MTDITQSSNNSFPAIDILLDDCIIATVVVYRDRAEVTRQFSIPAVDCQGERQVYIRGLSRHCNNDSIRVKTLQNNVCDILEVSYQEDIPRVTTDHKTVNNKAIEDIQLKLSELDDQNNIITKDIVTLEGTKTLLRSYSETSLSNRHSTKDTSNSSLSVSSAKEIMVFHVEEMNRIEREILQLNKNKLKISNEIKDLKASLSILAGEPTVLNPSAHELIRTLAVAIEVKVIDTVLQFQFSYVIFNATWTSSYDMRFSSIDNTLSLSYFAEVTQKTGENWTNCKLHLSTSNPAIGATPPTLPNKVIEFSYDYNRSSISNNRNKSLNTSYMSCDDEVGRRASFALLEEESGYGGGGGITQMMATQMPSDFKKAGVVGTGDAGSTVFTINRNVNIDADNKPHKVMITARQFTPQIVHYAVPSVSASVYLQAKVTNNSPYPLLASPNVSVYLDGNFISKSSIKQASSGESFQMFIGVDPSVKVEYLPIRTENSRKGWMSGDLVRKVSHSTVLHNTKSSLVKIILAESFPTTANDKIAIELLEPSPNTLTDQKATGGGIETSAEDAINGLSQYASAGNGNVTEDSFPKDFVTKNKITNNIVWLKTLQPQQKVQVNFSYRVTWPSGSNIATHER